MTVLITVGAGDGGSAVAHGVADSGHDIRDLDDFSQSTARRLMDAPPLAFVRGDGRTPAVVESAMQDVDAVIHLAAVSGAAVDRPVLASARSVCGETHVEHRTEAEDPAPRTPHTESKLAREPLTVDGDATSWRPFVHVRGTAGAFVDALDWVSGVSNVAHDNSQPATIADSVAGVGERPVTTAYRRDHNPGPSDHVDCPRPTNQGFTTESSLAAGIHDRLERFARVVDQRPRAG